MTPAQVGSFQELIATRSLPSLGPEQRPGLLESAELRRRVDAWIAEQRIPADLHSLLHSAALLWHDHLDESHTLSQEIHNSHGSFLHGIMHRREPDYGNAKYWFHRVGAHLAYRSIAGELKATLGDRPDAESWRTRLVRSGAWNPDAFIDACEQYAKRPNTSEYELLQRVQSLEFEALLRSL